MREIKFRAWDKFSETMHQVLSIENIGAEEEQIIVGSNNNDNFDVVENFELMQFTGLKDKNGKDIYEGDIVGNCDESRLPKHLLVIWGTDGFELTDEKEGGSWYVKPDFVDDDWGNHCKVIGNIYENPKLIKELE